MSTITRAQLDAYLDDALPDGETALVEHALRSSETLRTQLRALMTERDRGEHTLGAVWRRQRLSCPTREQLGNYLLEVLSPEQQDYLAFHLNTIGCPFCNANLADLEELQRGAAPTAEKRRRKYFDSSAGYLHLCKDAGRQ